MKTLIGEEALLFLASQISEPTLGGTFKLTVQVLNSAGPPVKYNDLELIERTGKVRLPCLAGLSFPERMEFVARGEKHGQGPFFFIWPSFGVKIDQAACNGLPVDSVTVSIEETVLCAQMPREM